MLVSDDICCLTISQYYLTICPTEKVSIIHENLAHYFAAKRILMDQPAIKYYFAFDRFVLAVEKWPWLLSNDLQTQKERNTLFRSNSKWVTVK